MLFFPSTSSRPGWTSLITGALVLSIGLVGGPVLGQGTGSKPVAKQASKPADPQARALLDEVSQAYKSLSAYSDGGQFTVAMTLAGKAQKQSLPLKLTFVRPNKLDLDAGVVRLTSDGKTLTTAVIPLKRYTAVPAPAEIGLETFRQGPIGAALFGGPSGVPLFVLLNFLTAADPAAALGQLGGSLQIAPADPKAVDPKNPALLIDQEEGPDIRLDVDPTTKLLSGIELQVDPQQLAQSAQAGRPVTIEHFGWSSGDVSTRVDKDRSFSYVPPKGFTKVDSLMDRPEGGREDERKFAVSKKVGKPAPDFTLTLLDGSDKTRTVTKTELAGKVVVIDFWATWCSPCLMELSEIQKLVDSLAKHRKEVLVIALSEDREPKELSEVRKLVEKTLKDKKITLTANPVGVVGLDPSASVGEAFDVEGLPTIVVLDGKGVVQSAHVGYSPQIIETLVQEIDTLLAGKPLPTHKKKAAEAAKKPSLKHE
jgi:thiol-disulfide isomerase/thioredoxin